MTEDRIRQAEDRIRQMYVDAGYVDEAGMPKHLPMGVNEQGQGPEDDSKAHHWVCWCGDPNCVWTRAFQQDRKRAMAPVLALVARASERIRHDHAYPMEVGPHHCEGCVLEVDLRTVVNDIIEEEENNS